MKTGISFDNNYNAIEPTIVLATRSGKMLGTLMGNNIHNSKNLSSHNELQFNISKYYDGKQTPLWDQIQDFKLIYCPEINTWFEIRVEISDSNDTVKNISCVSLGEAELSQINLYSIEINTEADISRDDYKPTVLFNETDRDASLLDRILEKAPHYSIAHVDASIASIQRTFTFDNTSIYDAFQEISKEIDCIFIINSGSDEYGAIARTISVYDLESNCLDCGNRGNFIHQCSSCGSTNINTGYGEDTSIFVCADNLSDGITYSTNTDSVKNCFRLEGGDDLMTATIANCNPNGSSYIWYISEDVRNDMSDSLKAKLSSYDSLYESYQNSHEISLNGDLLTAYNALVDKYLVYKKDLKKIPNTIIGYPALMNAYYDTIDMQLFLHDELMPTSDTSGTTASEQVSLLNSDSLSPVAVSNLDVCSTATATNAVLAMAKVIVDKRYRVKSNGGAFNGTVWTGSFTVTNYSDEEDTADSGNIRVRITDNYYDFVHQKLSKALSDSAKDSLSSVSDLFDMSIDNFKKAIRKYCLVSLQSFADACQACLDIMIEQGVANNETWADKNPNLYSVLYVPYYEKYVALQEEIVLRESEISIITGVFDPDGRIQTDGIQTLIQRENNEIHDALNFENYIGEDLWKEFASYRREDTYKNSNYISNGLSNSDLFSLALEFIDKAKQEIYKSATLQHSITSTLKNLLVMEEFKSIVDKFDVGNWIRIEVDNSIYRLRLLSYEISYDDLSSLSVVFSDVYKVSDGFNDTQSILNQAASMASSYDGIMRQAEQSVNTRVTLEGWVADGLALTKMKIVDNAKDQNVTFDEHGVLCRQYLPITESYDNKQLKIINRGLYLTDDGWLTSRAGIGDFLYYDPETGEMVESYGVIADTLVGNLVLSEKVAIYNMSNSILLDENGILITANATEDGASQVFKIRRKEEDEYGVITYHNVLWFDDYGNGHFKGNLVATSLTICDDDDEVSIGDYVDNKTSIITQNINDLFDLVDGEMEIIYSESQPAQGTYSKNDIWYIPSNNTIFRFDGNSWIEVTDTTLGSILQAAGTAQATADGKIRTFAQTSAPTGMTASDVGDLWIDTNDDNKLYRWNGTKWVAYRDTHLDYLIDTVDGKTTTYYSSSEPTNADENDIWYDTSSHKIKRKTSSGWVDITNEALYSALSAADTAQATADGKIRTFAQTSAPTGMTASDVGDLWIDTNDDNKLYRWNGTKWVNCRDEMITTNANNVKNIYNGTDGLYFTNGTGIKTVILDKANGLKITASDNSYFRVSNSAMGFFNSSSNPLLYYESGSMYLKGTIYAGSGKIGSSSSEDGGWTIGTDCIYSGSASDFGSSGGIYLGSSDGISIGSAIKLRSSGNLMVVKSDTSSSSEDDYAMKIFEDGSSYTLAFGGNLQFEDSFVIPIKHGGTGGSDRNSASLCMGLRRTNDASVFTDSSSSTYGENGDIGILYSQGQDGATMVGVRTTSTSTSPGYLGMGAYGDTGHTKSSTYFGLKNCFWNTPNLSGESVSSSWCRVGVGNTTSGACAYIVPLKVTVNNSSDGIDSIKINFNVNLRPSGCSRDLVSSITNGIKVYFCKGGGSIIGSTTYTLPASWQSATNMVRSCSTTIQCDMPITSGEYYVIFYSTTTKSLMWVEVATVSSPSTSIGAASGIYLKTGGLWKPLMQTSE